MGTWTTIDHDVRRKYDLSLNEYAVCDTIFCMSYRRPCSLTQEQIGEPLGLSRKCVNEVMSRLISRGLIEKVRGGYVSTDIWIAEMEVTKGYTKSNERLQSKVTKSYTESNQKLQPTIIATDSNKNSNDIIPAEPVQKGFPSFLISECDKVNRIPRTSRSFAREMREAKEVCSRVEDLLAHNGSIDVEGAIRWVVKIAVKLHDEKHWYLKTKSILPSTILYCYDEIITTIQNEKKSREAEAVAHEEHERLKTRQVV